MPMFSITDTTALYFKAGITDADLSWTGDVVKDLNSSMRGESYAVGSRTMYSGGAFLQTEFGYNDFDTLNIQKLTGSGQAVANPETVYGAVSIGFRF